MPLTAIVALLAMFGHRMGWMAMATQSWLELVLSVPIVLVTHDLAEARLLADRLVILDRGETLQSGPPLAVLSSPRNARVADLVGIDNHFRGVFRRAVDGDAFGRIRWGLNEAAVVLACGATGSFPDGHALTRLVAGAFL